MHPRSPIRLLLAFMALSPIACGDDTPRSERMQATVAANAATATTLTLSSGVSLTIPSEASQVEITVVLSSEPRSRRAGSVGTIVATPLVLGPEGTTFDKVVELTIPIQPSNLPAGSTVDQVIVVTAPHGSTAFVPLPTRRNGNAVVAETTHFSDFVAVVPTPGAFGDAGLPGDAGALPDTGVFPSDADIVDAALPQDAGPQLPPPNGFRHVFRTMVGYDGNLGGPAGADAKCMADPLRPTSGTFKALLVTGARRACDSMYCMSGPAPLDWVFEANTAYHVGSVGNESPFFTTDANAIVTGFPFGTNLGSGINFWIGMTADWLVSPNNCADFGDASAGNTGLLGWDADTGAGFFSGGFFPCDNLAGLVCVEQ